MPVPAARRTQEGPGSRGRGERRCLGPPAPLPLSPGNAGEGTDRDSAGNAQRGERAATACRGDGNIEKLECPALGTGNVGIVYKFK